MKRRLNLQSNKSYSLILPKTWVARNRLLPKTDLEVLDSGNKLIVQRSENPEIPEKQIIISNESEEDAKCKIAILYKAAHHKVKIIFKHKNTPLINKIHDYLNHLPGVVVEINEDGLMFSEDQEEDRCSKILKRCYRNIQVLNRMLDRVPKDDAWHDEVSKFHDNIHYLAEYSIRLINKEIYAETNKVVKLLSLAWALQSIDAILVRITNHRNTQTVEKDLLKSSKFVERLLDRVYDYCYGKANKRYENPSPKDIELKNRAIEEDIFFIQYICDQLIKNQLLEK